MKSLSLYLLHSSSVRELQAVDNRSFTSPARRAEQESLDRARPRDERDRDPKVIRQEEKKKTEKGAKVVDRAVQDGFKTAEGRKPNAPKRSKPIAAISFKVRITHGLQQFLKSRFVLDRIPLRICFQVANHRIFGGICLL